MVAHRSNAISQSTIPDELNSLLLYSKELGLDRMQIQAAGGNTSIKVGDTLWVKASRRWLSRADQENFMVPVSISSINSA